MTNDDEIYLEIAVLKMLIAKTFKGGWIMSKQSLRFEVAQEVDLFNLNIATNIYSHWHKFSQTAFKESLILLDGLKRVFCFD